MPIFNQDEDIPKVPTLEEKVIERETATVYQPQTKTDDIPPLYITEIQGNPWTTKGFYSQYLGADDYPRRLDVGLSETLQQYMVTRNFVLKATSELSFDLDEDVITTLSGTANVYPGIIVNQWDMFVAQIKDGRLGLFTIVDLPRPLSYLSYTAYEINYQLVEYVTESSESYLNLEEKVVKEQFFDPSNPLCPTANIQTLVDQDTIIKRIIKYVDMYYNYFYDRRNSTFVYRNENNHKTYDNSVVKFMNNMVPYKARNKTRHPRAEMYDIPSNDYVNKAKTVYDILLDNEINLLPIVDREYSESDTDDFYSVFVMHSILMTDIVRAVHPTSMSTLEGAKEPDGFYVFSEGFYDESPSTDFERLVLSAIEGSAVSFSAVDEEVDLHIQNKSMAELYKFIPIYIWLYVRLL